MTRRQEKIILDVINTDFLNNVKDIRKYFYNCVKFLVNNENNNDSKQLTDLVDDLEKKLKNFGLILNFFNNKDNIIVTDRHVNIFINYLNININQNYKIVDILSLINQNLIKIDFKNDSNSYYYYFKCRDIIINKPIFTRKIESNNKNLQQQQISDENKVNNYINNKKFERVTFKIIKEKYPMEKGENNDRILEYVLKLVYFNIEIIPKKYNNLQNYDIKVTSSYKSINNTLLLKLIEEQLKDYGQKILRKPQMKEVENMDINFIISIINIVHDYDNIFTSECFICKKNAKYSFIEKAFFPPYIKFVYDKYTIDKKSSFIHPQCIP